MNITSDEYRKGTRVNIKPLSVNECWQGKRFKTDKYKSYERDLLFILPKITLPDPPYKIEFEFGLSSANADWDNLIKPLQDILQKKYLFNDKDILKGTATKIKVPKGNEYFTFNIESL